MYNTVNTSNNNNNNNQAFSPTQQPNLRRSQSWVQPSEHSPVNTYNNGNNGPTSPYGHNQSVRALSNVYTEAASRQSLLERERPLNTQQSSPALMDLCREIENLNQALSAEQREKKEIDAKVRHCFLYVCVCLCLNVC